MTSNPDDPAAVARRALPLVDLTNLDDVCSPADIEALAAKARTRFGPVAALCIWPRFVRQAAELMAGSGIAIATVVNFPAGGGKIAPVLEEIDTALADGADEIDLVWPYRAFITGDRQTAAALVEQAADRIAGRARLKVILETGAMNGAEMIRQASVLVLAAGADVIKTSTGKIAVGATPRAAIAMFGAIAAAPRPAGFKAAGGIRATADAATYLAIADKAMGPDWVSPATFRFGASGLLDDLLSALGRSPA
jgi:deoxyribose-phosphate aldolase